MIKIVNGVKVEMTAEEVAAWEDEQAASTPPAAVLTPRQPTLFAAAAIGITDGSISLIEQAAQLSSAVYEDGWTFVVFSEARPSADYLIFAQTDIPAKIEQFKEPGYFELVFSDPTTGDPINPGRIDLQILEVR